MTNAQLVSNNGEEEKMEALVLGIVTVIGVFGLIAGLSLIGGTIVWIAWPHAMEAFPRLVNEEWVAYDIHWSTAVCLSFVLGVLIKAHQSNTNK